MKIKELVFEGLEQVLLINEITSSIYSSLLQNSKVKKQSTRKKNN